MASEDFVRLRTERDDISVNQRIIGFKLSTDP